MAAQRKDIMDIRQIILQKQQGVSNRQIEKNLQIHRNTVNYYVRHLRASGLNYTELLSLSDGDLEDLFPQTSQKDSRRYEELTAHFPDFLKQLRQVGCTREALWRDYLQQHPKGYSYTQFNLYLNKWLETTKVSGKLEHKAGEKMMVDYSGKRLSVVNRETGEISEMEVFVAVLPCSGYTYVEASSSQKRSDFIASVINALDFFGGVPRAIVPDNLKSAVSQASKYEAVLNRNFKQLGLHYGCVINPTRSRAPQDKALVENTVKLVYQRIFFPLNKNTFFSLAELNEAIGQQLEQHNNQQMKTYGASRKEQFLELEKTALNPLPPTPYQQREYRRAKVQKMGYIFFSENKNYYSVPYRYVGKHVDVQYTNTQVEVYYNRQRIASHSREFAKGRYVTQKEHLSSTHQFYQNWSPEYFTAQALKIGTHTQAYIQGLIASKTYPETAYKQALGILALRKAFDVRRIENACLLAQDFSSYGYHVVKNILENKTDMAVFAQDEPQQIPFHENLRGPQAYN